MIYCIRLKIRPLLVIITECLIRFRISDRFTACHVDTQIHRHPDIHTYIYTRTDRFTACHVDTQIHRHPDIHTYMYTHAQRDISDRFTACHVDTQLHRHPDIHTYIYTQAQIDLQLVMLTHRYTDTLTYIHTYIHTHRETFIWRQINNKKCSSNCFI